MKKYLTNILVRVTAILVIAAVCFFSYSAFELDLVFNRTVSYFQWIGITLIVTVISPTSLKSIKNDTKGIKIPRHLS